MVLCIQIAKDARIEILEKDANISGFIKGLEQEELSEIHLEMYQGHIVMKTFEFCSKYRSDPFKPIAHSIDTVRLTNYYNDFFDNLDDGTLVQIICLANFLEIEPLLKLICYKLSYKLRDMNPEERLEFFQLTMPEEEFSAEI